MTKVAVNPPRTPITEGSNGIAAATLPNVCKMPGPPAPFVPTPLPNVGRSGTKPKGYSKKIMLGGKRVAIGNASFGSQGDAASKGTGGGLISANTHGPTRFLSQGSMNVSFEGKSVHLLGDMMFNNCGPGGTPANSATMAGLLQGAMMNNPNNVDRCGPGNHDEVVEFPEVPADEADPQKRVDAMRAAASRHGDDFEALAAEHNIASGSITHGRQISRGITPEERAAGMTKEEQAIWAICTTCGFRREIDHAGNENSVVEVKSSSKAIKGGTQMTNNAALARNGKTVTYKSPPLGRQKREWLVSQGFNLIPI